MKRELLDFAAGLVMFAGLLIVCGVVGNFVTFFCGLGWEAARQVVQWILKS